MTSAPQAPQGLILPHTVEGWIPMWEISLTSLQEAIGGYVEAVDVPKGTLWCPDDAYGQPMNMYSLAIAGIPLCGNLVLTGGVGRKGETLPVPMQWITLINKRIPVSPKWRKDPKVKAFLASL